MRVKALPSDPRYCVSDTGIVYGISGKALRGNPSIRGYATVSIAGISGAKSRHRPIHSLVMEAFVGPRPDGMEILHANGIKTDNRLFNLRYGTRSENNRDSVKHGTHPSARRLKCPKGHRYTPENTRICTRRSGSKAGHTFRQCKECARTHNARKRERKAA